MATKKVNIDIIAKDKSKQALNRVRGNLDGLKKSVFNLRNAFVGLGAGLVIKNIIGVGKEIEGLQVRLKFLFGSVNEGKKAFDEMAKFASKVPFSLAEIQKGAGVLAVVSEDAQELAKNMELTGNVAAVTGLDFKTTAEQIQRSLSAGISAADLFRDRGVKAMLGFKAGATVSVEETREAFERVFGAGGKFAGATDELAKTFEGTLSMIGDKIFNFKRVLLEAGFFPELKKQFGDLNKFMEENQVVLDNYATQIGRGLAVAVERLGAGLKFVAKHNDEFILGIKVIIALKVASVFMKIATAVLNVAKATVALAAGTSAIKKGFMGLVGMFAMGGIAFVAFKQIDKMFDGFLEDIKEAGSGAGFNSLGQQLNKMGVIADKTSSKMGKLEEVILSDKGIFDITERAKTILEINNKLFEDIKNKGLDEFELSRKRMNDALALVEQSQIQLALLRDDAIAKELMSKEMADQIYLQKMEKLEDIKGEIIQQGVKERLKLVSDELDKINKMMQENYDKNLRAIKNRQFQELELDKLTTEQKKDLVKASGRELLDELSKHSKAAFAINKAFAIKDAIMSTAQGISKALAMGPWGIPLAVMIGGLGAVQIATIARQEYTGRKLGGPVEKGRPYIVGESGREMFVPNQSGNIVPNDQLGQGVTVNFNINTVDARGFNELLVNSRGVIVNMINSAVNEKGRMAIV
jgi:hypothetical protein